jgi:hypothetical protein
MAIRMLLITMGARTYVEEIYLSEQHELNLPKIIYTLLGGQTPESLYTKINPPVFLGVLSGIQLFRGCFLDSKYILELPQKWGIGLWSSLTVSSTLLLMLTFTYN